MIKELAALGSYQLSTIGPGAVATGLQNIRQCIDLILRTVKGSDPLRPEFGCDVFQFVDKPTKIAIPNMKKAIVEALTLWEERIVISSITHQEYVGGIVFNINYIGNGELDSLQFDLGNTDVNNDQPTAGIIISAFIPVAVSNGRYFIGFRINKVDILPAVPLSGFANSADLLAWVNINWKNYGRWYVADGKLVLYLAAGITNTVQLVITQTVFLTLKTQLYSLAPGEYYNVSLILNGSAVLPAFPEDTINNIEALLNWVRSNWPGNWFLESTSATTGGDFNNDFDDDFDIDNSTGSNFLVFQSSEYITGTLALI